MELWFSTLTERCFVNHVGLMSSVSIPALRRKASLLQVLELWGKRHPGSQESRNTKKSQHTTNLTQEIDWERRKRVVPLLWQEAAKNWAGGGQSRVSCEAELSMVAWVGGVLWTDLWANSGICGILWGILWPGLGLFFSFLFFLLGYLHLQGL